MSDLLERYAGMHRVDADGREYVIKTRAVHIAPGLTARLAEAAAPFLGPAEGRLLVVYDDNTLAAAGQAVLDSLRDARREVATVRLEPTHGREDVLCDDETVDEVTAAVGASGAAVAIAVGSGTISDLVKMASHRCGIPCLAVPTAPSNNGYTSAIAAILSEGVKTTQPCTPVVAVFADPEVLRHAPYRMIASGLGDLYSKPVSNADWRLSHRLNDSFYSPVVMEIVDAGNALLEGVAPRLPERDPDAVARLTCAIMLSGMGMQAAGSSGPASGGEHLISHYLDMTEELDGEPHDFHGCQVAVGTIVTARLYDALWRLDPATLDVRACVARLEPWETYRVRLDERFGPLAGAVMSHAQAAYPTASELEARLTRLVAEWDEVRSWVGETLRAPDDLAAELESARCPVSFGELGVSRPRALRAVRHCKDIRNRYTILHLVWELGLLDELAGKIVAEQYASR
jgi:glycerol-1-phosphate dehydrogenase [NAD(P)+]